MTSSISIQLKHSRWKSRLRPYGATVRAACGAAAEQGELTVVLADDAFVHELNRTYRGFDKPTNVLSFPSGDDGDYLGDIVLALETVEREAVQQGKSVRDHAVHLLVHGVLHLLGHDHERKKDAARMEALEVEILEKLGIANPYL